MSRRIFGIVAVLMISGLLGGTALAAAIVDTGPTPSSFWYGAGLSNNGPHYYYLAGQFTTTENHTITDIQGFMQNDTAAGITAAISQNVYDTWISADRPGNHIFSAPFTVGATMGWYGPSGLSWDLPAGTYWVVFEPMVGFSGSMPVPFPHPVAREAALDSFSQNPDLWNSYSPAIDKLGIRIYGNVAAPLPATVLLLGTALLGLAGFGNLRKR